MREHPADSKVPAKRRPSGSISAARLHAKICSEPEDNRWKLREFVIADLAGLDVERR
jgi:hypothetical protein